MARKLSDGGVTQQQAPGGVTASGVLSVVAGLAVFATFVWQIGPGEIWTGIRNVGWMFPVIIALGGLRFLVRAWAWTLCVDDPHHLPLRHAFTAVLAGDAVGNVTPLGPLVGEPAKSALVRQHLPIQPALTALAIENIFYTLSTAAMIAAGTVALLFAFDLNPALRGFSELTVAGIAILIAAALLILWRQPAIISRWMPGARSEGGGSRGGKLRQVEEEIYSFARRRRNAVFPVILLEGSFHALGVLETHLAMWMILGRQPLVMESFILETANRMITVAFKFIPFQLGVGEVGAAAVTQIFGMGPAPGTTLAIVVKARKGVWALVGGALLMRQR
jgi:hypothetical protein